MSDLKTLVENYFAPKPKILTKQMLYEIFDEVIKEQEEEDPAYEKALDTLLKFIIGNGFPKAEKHERSSTSKTIVITNAGGRPDRDRLIKDMAKQGMVTPNNQDKKDTPRS